MNKIKMLVCVLTIGMLFDVFASGSVKDVAPAVTVSLKVDDACVGMG